MPKKKKTEPPVFGTQPIFIAKSSTTTDTSADPSNSNESSKGADVPQTPIVGAAGGGNGNNGTAGASNISNATASSGAAGATSAVISSTASGAGFSAGGSDAPSFQSFKKVAWAGNYIIWLPPDATIKMRENIIAKLPIEMEVIYILS